MKTLLVDTREEWRAWLASHHDSEDEVWLLYPKRHTGRRRVAYEDAVREALCFGWIDSIIRRIDDDIYAQKFTPRRKGSSWSELNRRRYAALAREGRLAPAGIARKPPPGPVRRKASGPFVIPDYILSRLRENRGAAENFDKLPPSQRRLYVRWVDEAKKLETKQRRLDEAISRLEANQKLGMK